MESYYVYIVANDNDALYVGVTNDLQRRISEHKQGLVDGFTKKYNCKKLVYYELFSDVNQAISREKYLKGKRRFFKENLIIELNPEWRDLTEDWE